jgi:hypothetical protein
MSDDKYDADKLSRVIMLLYGKMDHGGPFWCYVAIKPSQFEAFKAVEKSGAIDLYNFDAFGEVIVSAEGATPPEEVTLKVAEMYGADASTFFQPMDPMVEIGKKIDEIKARDGEA